MNRRRFAQRLLIGSAVAVAGVPVLRTIAQAPLVPSLEDKIIVKVVNGRTYWIHLSELIAVQEWEKEQEKRLTEFLLFGIKR